jgi:hypothetical protein
MCNIGGIKLRVKCRSSGKEAFHSVTFPTKYYTLTELEEHLENTGLNKRIRPSAHGATQKKLIGHANYQPVTIALLPL